MAAGAINLNADMAEGFGAWRIGDDEGLLDVIGSANVACGFHAGDPPTMRRVVAAAVAKGVSVGAHPGFDDLWGFGRRRIAMKADDLEPMVAYQIGALQALAAYAEARVTHVKPHGALSNMAAVDEGYAAAIARAIRTVDRELVFVAIAGSAMEKAGRAAGLRVAREGFCDRRYEEDGQLTPRTVAGSVLHDPAEATAQAVRMATEGVVVARSGRTIPCPADTLCIHGDEPGAVALARAVRGGLEAAGIKLATIPELALE